MRGSARAGASQGDATALAVPYSSLGPLLSTVLLTGFDRAEPSGVTWIACLAIITGALIASGRLGGRLPRFVGGAIAQQ